MFTIVPQWEEKKSFKLANEPVMFALSCHFNNIFAYFHPDNQDVRSGGDKEVFAPPHHILSVMRWLIYNEHYIEAYIDMRKPAPIEFRCSQLIQHYGSKVVKDWIEMIYGKVL